MNRESLLEERNRLLSRYIRASGEEKIRILARLVVIDEELEEARRDDKASA